MKHLDREEAGTLANRQTETNFLPVRHVEKDTVVVVEELHVDAALRLAEQRAHENRRMRELPDEFGLATGSEIQEIKREIVSGLRSWRRQVICYLVAAYVVQTALIIGALYFTDVLR